MSLESLIKAGITPEIIANKLENVKKFYPDSSELSITESKNNLYKNCAMIFTKQFHKVKK